MSIYKSEKAWKGNLGSRSPVLSVITKIFMGLSKMKRYFVALPALLLAGLVVTHNTLAATMDYNQRQLKRLGEMAHHPELRGNKYHVYIVDGFRDVDVDTFMKTNFNSIQNVMFTNVIVTDKHGLPKRDKNTGLIVIEDDGC